MMPWNEIAPKRIGEWLDVYAKANNMSREILIASILPTVACLTGETTVRVDCKLKTKQINFIRLSIGAEFREVAGIPE